MRDSVRYPFAGIKRVTEGDTVGYLCALRATTFAHTCARAPNTSTTIESGSLGPQHEAHRAEW